MVFLVIGTFSDGMFSDGTFSVGMFSDGTFSDAWDVLNENPFFYYFLLFLI